MRNRRLRSIKAIAIAAGIGSIHLASLAAQSATQGAHTTNPPKSSAKWTPPRTAWGDPDLQGTYTSDNSIGVAFERPPQFAGRTTLNDEEYAVRERANAEQIAKDQSEFPETSFAQDSAANNAPRHWLDRPFVFFGHSMGAAVAFELARSLRRGALPLPVALLASGARAPQFRESYTPGPEPGEAEFIDELRRLEGLPKEVLDHEELMRLVLPMLRADARLYRNYVYHPEPAF